MSRAKITTTIITIAFCLSAIGYAMAGEKENLEIIKRNLDEVWHKKNLDVMDEIVAEDYVRHLPGGAKIEGREAYREMVKGFMTQFPDTRWNMDIVIPKDKYVVVYYSGTGTHTGEGALGPPTGKKWQWTAIVIHSLENGKMKEDWEEEDFGVIKQQLGLVPTPE
jgi:predicted ester cyclase